MGKTLETIDRVIAKYQYDVESANLNRNRQEAYARLGEDIRTTVTNLFTTINQRHSTPLTEITNIV